MVLLLNWVPYIFGILTPSDIWFVNIFLYSIGFLFTLLINSFAMRFLWWNPTCVFKKFFLFPVLLESHPKILLPRLMSKIFFSMFSSNRFIVLDLMFKSLFHFQLIFYTFEINFQFNSSACRFSVFARPFIEETSPSLSVLCTLKEDLSTINVWIYFWNCYYDPLVYKYVCLFLYKDSRFWLMQLYNIF